MRLEDIIKSIPIKPYFQEECGVIYCADCREVLPFIPDKSIDLVLTDPPYGIGEANGKNKSRVQLAQPKDYGVSSWDDEPIDLATINKIISKSSHSIIFGGNYYDLSPSSCWLVWDKDNSGDFADCELAWTNFPSAVRKYLWRWNGMLQQPNTPKEYRYHPTQKPIGLFSAILKDYSSVNDLILDLFLGSGTTAVACKKLGRKYIGIEIEERYVKIAVERLRQSVMDLKIESKEPEKQLSLKVSDDYCCH